MAIRQAPGVLAVDVDYAESRAIVGTAPDATVPRDAILSALDGIGYAGRFAEATP